MDLRCVVTKALSQGSLKTAMNWSVYDGQQIVVHGTAYGWGEDRARVKAEKVANSAADKYTRDIEHREYMAQRQYWRERYKVYAGRAFFGDRSNCWLSDIDVYRPDGSTVTASSVQGPLEVLQRLGDGSSPEEAKERAIRRGRMWVERDLDVWMRRVEAHRKAGIPL